MLTPESRSGRKPYPEPVPYRSTGIVYDPIFLEHGMVNHIESPRRLESVIDGLETAGLRQQLINIPIRKATLEEILQVHDEEYIHRLSHYCQEGGGWWDEDTFMSPQTYEVALYAAGGSIQAVEAVVSGKVHDVYALVRPPGHHARPSDAMGFCVLNNISIAAKYALNHLGVKKICIIDFDVHRGNGTQEIFSKEPRILYVSSHQYPIFPDISLVEKSSAMRKRERAILLPLPAGSGDNEFRKVYSEIVVPMVRKFKPQLILVSAGYDAHWADGMSNLRLTVDGYLFLLKLIDNLALELYGGGTVYFLEGGYNLNILTACINNTFRFWLGENFVEDPLGAPPHDIRGYRVEYVIERLKRRYRLIT